ncbi:asparaginyl-tRNA synthetase [mine drainage metagenome]|uniref:asparagine--tRNA ligase n=1 Tax=mine drainage metagenome TaxID=410659 RepID=T0ZHY8_9ZZZZ
MKSVPISKAKAGEGKEVTVKGWIYRKRSSGGKIFAVIRDRTGIMQCVIDKSTMSENAWNSIDSAYLESSIIIKGIIKHDDRAPDGVEMEAKDVLVVHSGEQFPITEYQSPEFLLDVRHLWLRSQRMIMAMKARSYVFRYAREFLDKQGFFEITPPLITVAGGETGADLFEVKYFDQKAYLTESSQLYAEAMIYSLEKVYSFAPSYRAEKSRTVKHLAEYWHLEPEMAYFNNAMNMKFQEKMVSSIANRVAKDHADILKFFNVDPESLLRIKPPFKRLSYDQAIALLQEKGSDKKWGDDFGVEEEKLLTEEEDKPIFVYNWPKDIKAFYMPVNPKDKRTVLCADMLAPHGHGEIIGGSEREWRYEELVRRMKELNMNIDNYSWYVDLRKYGSVPHAGFGLGIERVIKWMLNLDHIRDAIPFPRVINRLTP